MNLARLKLAPCALAVAMLCADSSLLAQWGDLTGQFVVDGKLPAQRYVRMAPSERQLFGDIIDDQLRVGSDGGIADVVVYVRSKIENIHPDYDHLPLGVAIENRGCRYSPHVVALYVPRQRLEIHNRCVVPHSEMLLPPGDKPINPLLNPGGTHVHEFGRSQKYPILLSCQIHRWERSFVLPRDNPYAAISAADGTFAIKNLPVGEHEFLLWHDPRFLALPGTKDGKVKLTISEGENHLPMADKDGVVKMDLKFLEAK